MFRMVRTFSVGADLKVGPYKGKKWRAN
jgi:hypothetical protein